MWFTQQRPIKTGKQAETLKRRMDYFEEELLTTRAKFNNMQVDELDDSKYCDKEDTGLGSLEPQV